MSVKKITGWLLLAFAVALLTSCIPNSLVERGIERELPKFIGPADSYSVDVSGLRVRSGEAERILAVGERVRPEGAPILDQLEIELRDVKYDRGQERLERVESAQATVRILPADLAAFLKNYRNIREATIALQPPNQATLSIQPEIGSLYAPTGITVAATGQLLGEGSLINFEVADVSAAGISLGSEAARRVSEVINPLADLSTLPVTLLVQDIRVDSEAVIVDVNAEPNSFQLP
ncbi:MAG: LmeA family phospholipid-binding protein [Leptolyngbyaceae cyanobacterium SM1_1_3]|nr:LmeA family phospholipid-binding protein [Leptolyngbyaceae cyanobacterium SM1_1_3]NJN04115.1 LmeA family phospholipid-binding protein [Leptolyngbyaceae cyanobacterium RM1_1_2]NJO09640.1 LmeA family phospholipid-binding protein [Leptolyngbyaceae cyanobacterium SL_1_1]